jgi:CheY-like chemotaxis protein
MPGLSGVQLQEELLNKGIEIPVIVLTGYASTALTVRARECLKKASESCGWFNAGAGTGEEFRLVVASGCCGRPDTGSRVRTTRPSVRRPFHCFSPRSDCGTLI